MKTKQKIAVDKWLLETAVQEEMKKTLDESGVDGAQVIAEQIYAVILAPLGW